MDFEEASILWPKIQEFIEVHKKEPNLNSENPKERRMAECIIYLKDEKRQNRLIMLKKGRLNHSIQNLVLEYLLCYL